MTIAVQGAENQISEFLQHLTDEKGYSPNTADAYGNDLGQFWKFLQDQPDDYSDWSKVDIAVLNLYIQEELRDNKGYEATTVARKVASIKSFFGYLSENSIITEDPAESLGSSPVARVSPMVLSTDATMRLLNAARKLNTPEGIRDAAVMVVLYATGFRSGELVSLDVQTNVDWSENRIFFTDKKSIERTAPMSSRVVAVLQRYVREARTELLGDHRGEQALFVNHRGERLTRQWIWTILKTYAEKAGIEGNVTPQTLRAGCIRRMLKEDIPPRRVEQQLGLRKNGLKVSDYV